MIYVLREQLSNSNTANMSLAGQHNSRLFAEALRGVVTSGIVMTHRPSTDVTDPQRMHNLPQLAYQTASNMAIALGLRLECHTNLKRMVEKNSELLNDPKRTVLIVWRHDQLKDLTNQLLAVRNVDMLDEPFEWDHDDYFSCITIDDSDECVLELNEDIIDGVLTDDEVPRSVQRRSTSNNDNNKKHAEADRVEEDKESDEEDEDEDESDEEEDEDESDEDEDEEEDEDQEESHQEPPPAKKSGEPPLRRKAQPAAPAKKAQNRTQKKERRVRHEPQRPPPAKFHREPSEADAGNCALM
jgi:hypothetical protein